MVFLYLQMQQSPLHWYDRTRLSFVVLCLQTLIHFQGSERRLCACDRVSSAIWSQCTQSR